MKPLEGVTIADFTVHAAGPFCTHMLSQLGAQCIKIESALRPDIFRKPHAVYGRNGPASFDQVASNKLSVRLNMKHPEGVALAKRLVAVSDVAAESFRAGVMTRLGLGYAALKEVKRDIVMVSVSSSGQTGPDSHFAGYAPLFGAWGGLGYLSGYSDGPPMEMRHVMDHSVGLNAALATVAALHQRRRTGQGSHVDVAAREVASSLVGDTLMSVSAGGHVERLGNDDYRMSPHGLYPTDQPDRWLSIAVASECQWRALAEHAGLTHLLEDPRFSSPEPRHANRRELDIALKEWSVVQNADASAFALQRLGVPAHVSFNTRDLVHDHHLRERGAIVDVDGNEGERRAAVGFPARFSVSEPATIERGTPKLGEHESFVYGELLKMSQREIDGLVERQIIF
ncbi:CaiB/BaiF CoA transferase family protein [Agrobacterium tumefaciens]|uniref:CaiB/BaiF CoA transferase family protein n=1 Tax=Agrobacterium tumefaciens TaxID=358 RepID=UPI0021D1C632|nr:CoA transferase [Agrobacterium tumefaciens]UXS05477.1 CoA transferase [Agrobacterium tumefaciens]